MAENVRSAVEREFAAKQRRAQAERDARVDEATALDPELAVLMRRRAGVMTEAYAQALYTKSAPDKAALRRQRDDIDKEIAARLRALKLPADQLDMKYECPICRDTGRVGVEQRHDCECFTRRMEELRLSRNSLTLSGGAAADTFDRFDEQLIPDKRIDGEDFTQRELTCRIRNLSISYCNSYPNNPRRNLLFTGTTGLGKTFLLNCIANELGARDAAVCYITAYRMVDAMRANMFDGDVEAFNAMIDSDVLIIDDLGSEPIYRTITIEMLFTLLNERMREGRHTVIATNLAPSDLNTRYGERVVSRLLNPADTQIFYLKGSDLRRQTRRS